MKVNMDSTHYGQARHLTISRAPSSVWNVIWTLPGKHLVPFPGGTVCRKLPVVPWGCQDYQIVL